MSNQKPEDHPDRVERGEDEVTAWAIEKGLRVNNGIDPGHVEAHAAHKHRKATTPKAK